MPIWPGYDGFKISRALIRFFGLILPKDRGMHAAIYAPGRRCCLVAFKRSIPALAINRIAVIYHFFRKDLFKLEQGIYAELAGPQQKDSEITQQKGGYQIVFAKELPIVHAKCDQHGNDQGDNG